jgi:hypothetical protein
MINWPFQEEIMKPCTRLYACLRLLAILHIVEQLIFGMQDLRQLQYLIAIYERRFGDTNGSIAALVTISGRRPGFSRCAVNRRFAAFLLAAVPPRYLADLLFIGVRSDRPAACALHQG